MASPDETSCLTGHGHKDCTPSPVPFPKCQCMNDPYSSPFVVSPLIEVAKGRKAGTTLYCFTTGVVVPEGPQTACSQATVLQKMEFWANDKRRQKITGIGVQAAGATKMGFMTPGWGAVDDNTLRANNLNWSKQQADGGKVCLELSIPLDEFCEGGVTDTCWATVFGSRACCPTFMAAVVPE
ncbi:hypothetical protein HYH03_008329 [Edaphochlamys debaryana]|nr:hypothetical protein HYH03_008329 [Edaphochlamys debaryana]|eukprot:KAG2493513.1 hypothetical protein HYH03_008329 [Edaphochlamys debaryana]